MLSNELNQLLLFITYFFSPQLSFSMSFFAFAKVSEMLAPGKTAATRPLLFVLTARNLQLHFELLCSAANHSSLQLHILHIFTFSICCEIYSRLVMNI